ncbi:3-beta hydroxysteroid dehydrogenase [Aminobacter sp. DSM 101952]|uniref:NAD(P)-dependent oxidoreductase n=1 Tax=Aminobacter sp. DSM 101952 TaxID=2735891 RepID=UPI0006F22D80|nr:NAD(P)H-binding protein [Aminobacter sp. DSM 101952]KQU75329.1 3-beta hydroxysteroid dehydrogenase [Aminobacter sp. DSM 101952]
MKIALIGASGFVGGAVLKEATSRGHAVSAIVRSPEKVAPLDGVTAVKADVTDAGALKAAIADSDIVISAFNGGWGDPDIYAKHLAGSKAIAAAAKAAGKRVIIVGGAGSLEIDGKQLVDAPDFPAAYKDGALAARDALAALRKESGLDWSFVSPAILLAPGERTGKFRLGTDQPVFDAKGESRISVEDLAVAILDEAATPKHSGKRFTAGY